MRRIVLIVATALAVVTAVPAGGAVPVTIGGTVKVHVTPGTGGPHTAFNVSFRNLAQTGQVGTMHRAETIAVQGTQHRACVWSAEMPVPAAAAQQVVHLALRPRRMTTAGTGAWCTGTFRGTVVLDEHFNCPPPQMCPMIAIRPQTIGRFSFTVKRRS